jgi:hypothetical protein
MIALRRIALLTIAWGLAAGLASPLTAAEPGTGWHIVRPGENLHAIAERYLGSRDRWPELARLNPEVQDPNRLEPGQRIRVAVPGASDAQAARVARLSRKVEAQPTPIPWEDARQDDLLLDRDGLRTFPRSSVEMAFTDGTRLLVTESSLVFLQKTGGPGGQLQGMDRKSVEIVQGQADVEGQAAGAGSSRPEVEIVLGPARATTRPAPTGGSRARARRVEQGGAKLMVYGGEGEMEAGGAKVTVPEGMGTSVESQGPPAPPEKLLPAPQAIAPPAGGQVECANPRFAWTPVPDAASYTIEVCRDESCGALVERAVGLVKPEWRADALPREDLYWRVTARGLSGLDGYPGAPVRLAVASDQKDLAGPKEVAVIEGPQVQAGDTLWAGPTARIVATWTDPETGDPLRRDLTQNPAELASFATRWAQGGIPGATFDSCGNAGSFPPIPFLVDDQAPEITWDVVDLDEFPNKRRRARKPKGLSWSGGASWKPLEEEAAPLRIRTDTPQLLLHGARFDLGDEEVRPGKDQMLRARIRDGGAGVDHLTFQLRSGEGGKLELEIEMVDLVGNSRKVAWGVER